jgi:hypothetical protein
MQNQKIEHGNSLRAMDATAFRAGRGAPLLPAYFASTVKTCRPL